jgi:hypothetical protein
MIQPTSGRRAPGQQLDDECAQGDRPQHANSARARPTGNKPENLSRLCIFELTAERSRSAHCYLHRRTMS